VASFNEQCDPPALPAVLLIYGKTTVNNKGMKYQVITAWAKLCKD
jgi:hypothetical protein